MPYRFVDLIVSPLRCTSSGLSLPRITAVLLITNPPVVAVTFQRTTLAAHMKRKSDTLCHAEIPGLLCSSLIDLQYSTVSLEKKGEKIMMTRLLHLSRTFVLR
jgi:hypothetical protein